MNISGPMLASPLLSQRNFDASVPNTTAMLLADTLRRRSYLFVAEPYSVVRGAYVARYYSNDGYASYAGDTFPDGTPAAHLLFRARLADGAVHNVESRVMSNGQLTDGIPTYGVVKVIIADDDPSVVGDLSLLWRQARLTEYLGRPDWRLSQFVPFARGLGMDITSDSMSYAVSWGSPIQRYVDLELSPEKYLGLGGCVRGNGTNGRVSGALTCPAEFTLEMSVKPLSAASGTRKRIAGWQNGSSAGQRFLTINGTGQLEYRLRNDAATLFLVTDPDILTVSKYTRVAIMLSAGVMYLYVAGELVRSAVVTGTVATLLSTMYWLASDAPDEWADVEVSRVLLWDHARTQAELQDSANVGHVIDSASAGLVAYWKCADQAPGNITVFDSTSGAHNLTLSGSAIFTGSKTGEATLAGKCIPRVRGRYLKFEPVPVDSLNGIFQLDSGSIASIDTLEHRGLQPYVYDGDVADLTVTTFPAAGHWKSCLALGMLQLNAAITGHLVASGRGSNTGADGYVEDCARLVKKLALESGSVIGDLELISISRVSAKYPYPVSYTSRLDSVTVFTAMSDIMMNILGKPIGTRDGRLAVWVLEPPSDTSKFDFDDSDITVDGTTMINKTAPVKQIIMGYARYATTQGPSDLSTSSQDAVNDLGREYRTFPSQIITSSASTLVTSRDTSICLSVDATAELARELAIWSEERRTHSFQLTNGLHQYNIGDTVRVTLPQEGLDNGFVGVIVAYSENVPNDIKIEVFGNVIDAPRLITDSGADIITDDGSEIITD